MSQLASGVDPAAPSPWNEVAERSSMPVLLVALSTRRVVARSKAAEALVGPIEWAYDLTGDREQSRKRLDLLVNGVINGYHFTSTLTTPSGSPVQLEIDVQRFNDAEGRDLALVLLAPRDDTHEAERADALVELRATCSPAELNAPLLVGTVDRDWRIERLSSDVKGVLGYDPNAIIGTSFTHWVHPGDVRNLLIGIGRALEDDATVRCAFVSSTPTGPGARWWRRSFRSSGPSLSPSSPSSSGRSTRPTSTCRRGAGVVRTASLPWSTGSRSARVAPSAVTRGSSVTLNGWVALQEPTVSRTEYFPGTAVGPFGPSGRAALIHGPG